MMELPWPKWMEFVVLGITLVPCLIALKVIDRFQKGSIGQSEKQDEQGVPLTTEAGLRQTA
jgi:hypothetical protein